MLSHLFIWFWLHDSCPPTLLSNAMSIVKPRRHRFYNKQCHSRSYSESLYLLHLNFITPSNKHWTWTKCTSQIIETYFPQFNVHWSNSLISMHLFTANFILFCLSIPQHPHLCHILQMFTVTNNQFIRLFISLTKSFRIIYTLGHQPPESNSHYLIPGHSQPYSHQQ